MPEFKRYSEVGEVAIENAEGIDSIITELDNIIADLNQKIVNTLHRVVGGISGRLYRFMTECHKMQAESVPTADKLFLNPLLK